MVNTYKLKLTNLQQDILRLLFIKVGTVLNQRQISKELNVSQPAVMKALPELKKKDLILTKQDKESKRWSIELNRNNHKVIQLKRVDNLKQIYETGLADFLDKEFAGSTIILFGSYSKGEDAFNSDIDIGVVGRKEKKANLTEFEKTVQRKINIEFFESWNGVHKELKENLCNGIVLEGGIEL
ncbi:MAG: nucleotidyltransferase domain-containing protein [Nanoarchaeota archaeon]|nr:nucleotidyltransferase domain-containing protein [Nanoarchaeota archaeon]